jgi:hypothetical protein
MKNRWWLIIAWAGLACLLPAADKGVNFSGTWILDPGQSRSDFTSSQMRSFSVTRSGNIGMNVDKNSSPKNDAPPVLPGEHMEHLSLLIVQTNAELQVTRKFTTAGDDRIVLQKFLLDGSQCLNIAPYGSGELVSRTGWKKNKLINAGTETTADGHQRTEVSLKEEYSISKNGKQLTIKTTRVTPEGASTLRQVFKKRRSPSED